MMVQKAWRRLVEYFAGREDVIAVYLFGSRARGEGDHLSDVDLAVLLRQDLPAETMWRLEDSFAVEVGGRLDHEAVDLFVLNLVPLAARFEVISTGTLLLSKDEMRRTDYEVAVMTEWWDFKEYEALFDHYLLERIKEDFGDAEREQYHAALGTAG
jgi:predicted nucleotidyltransferase